MHDGVVLLDSKRIVIPRSAVKPILSRLHSGHPGVNKSLALAQKLFYWPGMNNDIKTYISRCPECVKFLPSQPTNPCATNKPSTAFGPPMSQVSVDLFDFAGKKHLVCVDRWSGFPLYKRLQTLSTAAVISILESWFNVLGWPSSIRSDGGPQFCGPFSQWCKANNVIHELSSPYNPKSNGQAEAAVKDIKH